MTRENVVGTCYLLHFDGPYLHAKHYLGWSENGVQDRIALHLAGNGSPLVRAAVRAGANIQLSRLFFGVTRHFERRMKKHGKAHLCPSCVQRVTVPNLTARDLGIE
jgi:predicted GIY-YIG superfamily endonuclease